jgi:hypothetical protein
MTPGFPKAATAAALLALLAAAPALANGYEARLRALADARLRAVAEEPALIEAIRAQNAGPDLSGEEIARLDADWRAQVGAASAPLVEEVAARPASRALAAARDASEGLLTEIFAMDRHGLNVAVSDPTSDYWQGDEAKWLETYAVGADAVHVSEVEFDESTQTYQAQVSLAVPDPDTGAPIGAVTFGVNVEFLE